MTDEGEKALLRHAALDMGLDPAVVAKVTGKGANTTRGTSLWIWVAVSLGVVGVAVQVSGCLGGRGYRLLPRSELLDKGLDDKRPVRGGLFAANARRRGG